MSINAKYNTKSNIYRKAVIFGLTATVDSAGSVDSIHVDMRNSLNPVVMILLLFDIVCVLKCFRLLPLWMFA